jgi:hypothetical protein
MRKVACFTMGNVWLMIAVAIWLGRDAVRYAPTRYAFFGVGGWHTPFTYNLAVVACVIIGIVFLARSGRSAKGEE